MYECFVYVLKACIVTYVGTYFVSCGYISNIKPVSAGFFRFHLYMFVHFCKYMHMNLGKSNAA